MFDGPEPIYQQIAEQIRQDVVEGTLKEEEQVMSTTQYSTTFRINPATAAKAFATLVEEDILYQKRGLGTFVAAGAREQLLQERRDRFVVDVLEPVLAEARRIGIPLSTVRDHVNDAITAEKS